MQSKSFSSEPYYSDRYHDEEYEYRHVICPKDWWSRIPKEQLMTETEWRSLGIQQSIGWEHYMIHEPGRLTQFVSLLKLYVLYRTTYTIVPKKKT
ncbi:DgyrCDS4073 [Dimorphilus gyrociliatus]|uniref:Cyclin-dependent kinases regulatory subunit n=1 Tax=Dimorphilus gyrociliatus TaxID=2664684 RepID=A0A7I8VFI7_9ANNE|nr:DgyrCDS4073 [Dimorphilus gyrociliatus]